MPPEMVVVPEREAAMAKAAAVEDMSGAIPAAATMEHRAAGVKTTAVETTAVTTPTMTAPTMTTATMTTAAMTAADFDGEPVGNLFRRGCGTRIDQRQRFRALTGCSGQQQYRCGRKTKATDKAAPGICNFHHL